MSICYHRKVAWITDKGLVFHKPLESLSTMVTIPCGHCIACRVNQSQQWATRAMHEAAYVSDGCFVTLTYDNDHVPKGYNLDKRDLQLFLKRLRITLYRKSLGHIRAYFACGEYGTKKGRPHYHLLLLGWKPNDLVYHHESYCGDHVFTSPLLDSVWDKGYVIVGECNRSTAGYVARYQKKANVDNSGNRVKPFFLSSRNIPLSNGEKGSLGAQWVLDNHESLRQGFIRVSDRPNLKLRIPEYYFDLLSRWFPDEYDVIKQYRLDFAMSDNHGMWFRDDCGKASLVLSDDADFEWLREFSGVSSDDVSIDVLLNALVSKVRQLDDAQTVALSRLKRNQENG